MNATLETAEKAVANLSPAELAEFRKWFAEYDGELWDAQIEADARAGKLDAWHRRHWPNTTLASRPRFETLRLASILGMFYRASGSHSTTGATPCCCGKTRPILRPISGQFAMASIVLSESVCITVRSAFPYRRESNGSGLGPTPNMTVSSDNHRNLEILPARTILPLSRSVIAGDAKRQVWTTLLYSRRGSIM